MMMNKYRVHEVAKDLGAPSKSVVDLLQKYFEGPVKHMTAPVSYTHLRAHET